jgi:tetratricopeptide (TPR) repeat protein
MAIKLTLFIKSLCIVFVFLFSSCDSSLKYLKTADKLAKDGNYSDAADNFYTALLINPTNIKAKQGLQKNAQLVLDAKFGSFAKLVVEGSSEQALRQYIYCKDYFNNLKNIGIDLNWLAYFDPLYEETKQEFIGKQYEIGLSQMKENKFDKAEFSFAKILEFDSSYKNVSVLRMQSLLEPLYNQGLNNIEAENYKAAYKIFKQVASFDATYKNTLQMLDYALQKASLPLAAILVGKKSYNNFEDLSFYQVLVARFSKSKNPFLKIIDRNNLEKLLKEQELGMSGIIDVESAVKAGKMIGAKYFLLIDVTEVKFDELKPTTTEEPAYQSYSERVVGANGEAQSVIKFKKINYSETKKYRKVEARVSYQLVSVQTGQIVSSEVFNAEQYDAHAYAKFNGNIDNLYPNLPAGNFMPDAPVDWKEKFYELNRELASNQILADKAFTEISQKILDDIHLYIQ